MIGTVSVVTATHIIVANVGDSPCITFSRLNTHTILHQTDNHIPENPNERARIERNGGHVTCEHDGSYRVDNFLSISRAFGHSRYVFLSFVI